MTLVAMDLNASRVRAVLGAAGRPGPLPLDGMAPELPLAVSLEGRSLRVGRAGVALCRLSPHLACVGFLPHLGERRQWGSGALTTDASAALALILQTVSERCGRVQGVALALPGYLSPKQRELTAQLCRKARLVVLGSVDGALAAALASQAEHPWSGLGVVVDADEHALSCTAVEALAGEAHVVRTAFQPALGLRLWKERLLADLADRCVRQSRRDPRDSAPAEQSLFEQLDGVLEACQLGRTATVAVQSPQWYQNLIVTSEEVRAACAGLLRQTLGIFEDLRRTAGRHGPANVLILTAQAARLPGLAAALEDLLVREIAPAEPDHADDFALDLSQEEATSVRIRVLDADAVARSVHALASTLPTAALSKEHLLAAPLPAVPPTESGPPRLHFRGHDHLLQGTEFTLGRDPACNLAFDSIEFPTVSARHCSVRADQQHYTLFDHSRHGTLVNDRPVVDQLPLQAGDWIRLGTGGPLLRFLGAVVDRKVRSRA